MIPQLNIKRGIRGFLLGALILLLVAVPVLAAYYAYIDVTESNGTSYTQLAMNYSLNVTYLVDNGYISSNGMDTRITDESLNVLPHMLADDRFLWVDDLPGSQTTRFIFFTGQTALNSTPTITGHGGYVTVADNASIELGGVYAIVFVGYVDTSAGANKNIARKDGAYRWFANGGNVTYNVTGGNNLTATGIASGDMEIIIYQDGVEMWLMIDGVEEDRTTASLVPDNANDLVLFENDVCPYVNYFSIWIA